MTATVSNSDMVSTYERLAANYDRLHSRWLRYAGGEAQAALEASVRVLIKPGTQLLDVGCGTGKFARKLIAEGMSPDQITLLDPSLKMLSRCGDIPAFKVNGRMEALPFDDCSFDIVTSAWSLETSIDSELAICELCRVTKKDGMLCMAFCAKNKPTSLVDWSVSLVLTLRRLGSFLNVDSIEEAIRTSGSFQAQRLPCNGPVAAIVAHRI